MKLRGSLVEQRVREDLIRSNLSLRHMGMQRLADALETANVNLSTALVLSWIPEQAEDIYSILASASEVVTVEVPRINGEVITMREALDHYLKKCSRFERLRIAVALDILLKNSEL